jgi:hypothetical protein
MPINEGLSWGVPLRIESSVFVPAGDPRELGVVLDWVRIAPTTLSTPLPPAIFLLAGAIFAGMLTLALRTAGLGLTPSLLIPVLASAALALGTAQRPIEILPFLPRLAALPIVAMLGLLLIQAIIPLKRSIDRPATLAGEHLPLLFGIAWWMLPVFQGVQILDGASIGVGDETFIMGGITTAFVAGAVAIGYNRSRNLAASERATFIARYALIGMALGATVHLCYATWYAFTRSGKDFWILFKGARDWARGGSLYDMTAVLTNHVGAVFKVPPFYGMLFTPFVFMDGLQILFFHRVLNVLIAIATVIIWLRMWKVRPLWWGVAGMIILLNNRPLADTIAYGQIDLLLLFLLTLALWAMRAERDGLAGALIALGALFKIYPVIILAFFVLKGRWNGLIGFAVGMLVYNGIAIAVMGWEMHRMYLFDVVPQIGGTTSWVENQTISAFLARLVDVPFDAHIFENRSLSLLGTALSGLVSLFACWLVLRPAEDKSSTFALQYAQFPLLMVFAVPAAWMHYETLLVLVFGALILHLREREVGLPRAVALGLAFALIGYGNQWSFNGTTVMGILTVLGVSYKFYGMLLLGAVLVDCLLEVRAPIALPSLPRRLDLVLRGGQR